MIVWWWSGKTAGIWNAAEFCNFANLINTSAADVEKDGFPVSGWPYGGRLMASRVFAVGYFPYLMTDLIFYFFFLLSSLFSSSLCFYSTGHHCYLLQCFSSLCCFVVCVCFKAPSPFPLPKWKWISTSTSTAAAVGNCKIQIALECIIIIELHCRTHTASLLFCRTLSCCHFTLHSPFALVCYSFWWWNNFVLLPSSASASAVAAIFLLLLLFCFLFAVFLSLLCVCGWAGLLALALAPLFSVVVTLWWWLFLLFCFSSPYFAAAGHSFIFYFFGWYSVADRLALFYQADCLLKLLKLTCLDVKKNLFEKVEQRGQKKN